MVSSVTENLIYGMKLSTVGPGRVSGSNVICQSTSMDLAMKLHYLRAVYFFSAGAAGGLAVVDIKQPMFPWFNLFYMTCGRFRRSDSGYPFIKCNDGGVRFIEARTDKTVDEWLKMRRGSMDRLLVSNQVVGPELAFSPLVLIQVTWFSCGGISVGLSWAHVLGDPSSASHFMKVLGQIMVGNVEPNGLPGFIKPHPIVEKPPNTKPSSKDPLSLKRVDLVGDYWLSANNCQMEAYSFHIGPKQLSNMQCKLMGRDQSSVGLLIFESICAVIWQCLARIRGCELRTVTLCKSEAYSEKNGLLSNSQSIRVVESESPIADADLREVAALIADRAVDERTDIEAAVEEGGGLSDFIIYGANLTFVDLEEANLHGFRFRGHKAVDVSYDIDGVGDEGVVLVLPWPEGSSIEDDEGGRVVTVKLPKDEVLKLKVELERELWIN